MSNPPAAPPDPPSPPDEPERLPEPMRERAVELLGQHFALDHLSMEDYERRVNQALEASSGAQLDEILGALPAITAPVPPPSADSDGELLPLRPTSLPSELQRYERLAAIFGEANRTGVWVPARETTVSDVFGSVVLDLREARFGPGQTKIIVQALMGSVEVVAPPELAVECGGTPIFGEFDQRRETPTVRALDSPTVRIEGLCVFGSVEIETRRAGESKRAARRRRRRERRGQD